MTVILRALIAAVLACGLAAGQTPAATQPTFVTVNYYKVDPDKAEQYEALAADTRRVVEAGLASGEIIGYVSSRVVMAGAEAPFNYTSNVMWAKTPVLERSNAQWDALYTKAGVNPAGYRQKLAASGRRLVRAELWRMLETVGSFAPGDLARVDLMKVEPANVGTAMDLERTVYKPLHAKRIQDGNLKGWSYFSLQLPGGDDREYNFRTVQIWPNEEQMFRPLNLGETFFRSVHPTRSYVATVNAISGARRIARSYVVRVRDVIRAQAPATTTRAR